MSLTYVLMSSPGPMADQAFRTGLAATVGLTLVATVTLWWTGHISITVAVMALFLGLPVLFILVACILGIWLGYNEEPLSPVTVTDYEWPLASNDDRPPK